MEGSSIHSDRIRAVCWGMLAIGAALLLGTVPHFDQDRTVFSFAEVRVPWLLVGLPLVWALLLAMFRRFVPTGLLLASGVVCLSAFLIYALGTHRYGLIKELPWNSESKSLLGDDPPYAYRSFLSPNGSVLTLASYFHKDRGNTDMPGSLRQEKQEGEFDVICHIDDESNRKIKDPRPRFVFAGCSFTFGMGVSDDEAYPACIARELSPTFRIVNSSYSGTGTAHALVMCEQEMKKDPTPFFFIYGMIAHHLNRNGRRKSWFQNYPGNTSPWYRLEGSRAVRDGFMKADDASEPDDAATSETELRRTVAMITTMRDLCSTHDVKFLVVCLDDAAEPFREQYESLIKELAADNIPLLRIENVEKDFYPINRHPRASWHHEIAKRILQSEPMSAYRSLNQKVRAVLASDPTDFPVVPSP